MPGLPLASSLPSLLVRVQGGAIDPSLVTAAGNRMAWMAPAPRSAGQRARRRAPGGPPLATWPSTTPRPPDPPP
jgi:hypothetical protein